jgi:hypothetical protein
VLLHDGSWHRPAHAAHLRTTQAHHLNPERVSVARPARGSRRGGARFQPLRILAPRAVGTERSVAALRELSSSCRHGSDATIAAGGVKSTFVAAHAAA